MKVKLIAAICVFVVAIPMSNSFAANGGTEQKVQMFNYGVFKMGMFQPSGDLDDANYDAGLDLSLAYGRYLTKHLILETGFDLFFSDKTIRGHTASTGNYIQDNIIAVGGLIISLKAEVPVGPVRLYGGGGIGIYGTTLYSDVDSDYFGSFDQDESDTVFGAQLVLGANYDINNVFFIGLEGKYRVTDDVDIYERVATVPMAYSGNLNGYSIVISTGLRF